LIYEADTVSWGLAEGVARVSHGCSAECRLPIGKVQNGKAPNDSKPMPSIGKGVEEIRVWDESGTYRVIYTARLKEHVYVLHAFQKKTQATSKRDIEVAQQRFNDLMRGSR
jgi:phage-related protein